MIKSVKLLIISLSVVTSTTLVGSIVINAVKTNKDLEVDNDYAKIDKVVENEISTSSYIEDNHNEEEQETEIVETIESEVEVAKVEKPKAQETKNTESKTEEPKVETPEVQEPETEEPNVDIPEVQEPEIEEPNVDIPEVQDPEIEEPKVETPEVQEPETDEPKVEEPEVQEPETEDPKVEDPEVQDPEAEEPKVEDPEVQEPEIDDPKVDNPETDEPEEHTHNFGEWEVTVKNTCNKTGIETRKCTICGEKETRIIEANKKYCELERAEYLDKEATCESPARVYKICKICESIYFDIVGKPLGHEWDTEYTTDIEATCTKAGQKSIHCSREGCTEIQNKEVIPATGHTWNEYITTIEPTCEDAGSKYRTCKECNTIEKAAIVKLGHEWDSKYTTDIEATCTEEGLESIHCLRNDCTKTSNTRKTSLAAHQFGDITIIDAPTCVKDGVGKTICEVCNKEEIVSIPATSIHDWGDVKYFTENECIGTYQYRECKNCDSMIIEEGLIPGKGHKWSTDNYEDAECEICHLKLNWTNKWAEEHNIYDSMQEGWEFNGEGELRVRVVWWVVYKADTTMSEGFKGREYLHPDTVITADYVYTIFAPEAKEGYEFIGWYVAGTEELVCKDQELKATWKNAHQVLEARYQKK